MSECGAMRESMPLLLTESLDPVRRENAHQHIERCASCGNEWAGFREAWLLMDALPEVDVPARVKERFLERAGISSREDAKPNVIPFVRRPAFRWLAQAAAVAVIAGGGYFAGRGQAPVLQRTPATVTAASEIRPAAYKPLAIAETRVLDAGALSPNIEGRPDITNVQFVDADPADQKIAVSFDVTSRWTVKGNPKDRSMVRLLSYMLEHEASSGGPSNALDQVRRTYSDPAFAEPEIANALAKVLRNDTHAGARLRAVDTLSTIPPAAAATETREALIEALKTDPNPAVRIKAVEALANLARSGATLDPNMVDILRQKASQDDENMYVRVKAAEALSNIR
jgi:hypothetical protein